MPSGPRFVRTVLTAAGFVVAPAAGVPAAGATPATNRATASISAPDSVPANAGIDLRPLRTADRTVAASGLSSPRFGPTLPVVPARASVWQPPQLETKIALPCGAAAAVAVA